MVQTGRYGEFSVFILINNHCDEQKLWTAELKPEPEPNDRVLLQQLLQGVRQNAGRSES